MLKSIDTNQWTNSGIKLKDLRKVLKLSLIGLFTDTTNLIQGGE